VLGRGPYVDAPGHELYMLFVGVNPAMYSALGMQRCPGYGELFAGTASSTARYFPIQFSPSDSPLAYLYSHPADGPAIEGRIVELRRAAESDSARRKRAPSATPVDWEFVRLREDRQRDVERGAAYFGNDFRVAEMTWLNYIDEFPLEQLWLGAGADYFATPRAGVYLAQTSVMNFAKTRLIESLRGAPFVVDLGAGRGSDLGRYASAEVGHLIAVDNDRAALAELVRRRYEMMRRRGAPIGAAAPRPPSSRGLTVHIVAADANGPAAALVAKLQAVGLPPAGADALVCNLAAHYFMATAETMKNFVAIARAVVRPGGTLALTVLAGDLVHRLFTESRIGPGDSWDRLEAPAYSGPDGAPTSRGAPEARKYSLRRDYSSAKLEVAGQGIGVLLPFSDGKYYPEYLLNVDALSRALAARGFGAPVRTPISDSIGAFTAQHRALAEELSAADREWLALYATLTYTREK
jgi:SAM-dependent methyltransferase